MKYCLGLGPLPWVLNVELFPPEARVIYFSEKNKLKNPLKF